MRILVSACLLGVNCKYSGGNNLNESLLNMLKDHNIIPICPEQLGGLTTPRTPAEINGGSAADVLMGKAKVINKDGFEVTRQFIAGAEETLRLAKEFNCGVAILKANSPSCGCGTIYDGSFGGKLCKGNGLTSQLLIDNHIRVYSENNYKDMLL